MKRLAIAASVLALSALSACGVNVVHVTAGQDGSSGSTGSSGGGLAGLAGGAGAGGAGTGSSTAPSDPAAAYAAEPMSQIQKDAETAWDQMTSVHFSGSAKVAGKLAQMELSMSRKGACTGTMTIGGGHVKILSNGTHAYLNGDAGFYRAVIGAAADGSGIDAVAGKWVTGFPMAMAKQMCPAGQMFGLADKGSINDEGTATPGTPVGGVPTVDVSDGRMQVVVAATAPHYILSVTEGAQHFTFSAFNRPVTVTPPAGALDIGQGGGGI